MVFPQADIVGNEKSLAQGLHDLLYGQQLVILRDHFRVADAEQLVVFVNE